MNYAMESLGWKAAVVITIWQSDGVNAWGGYTHLAWS